MKLERFEKGWFEESKTLKNIKDKFGAGQVAIVGGSELFHGAPIMALKAASMMVGMVYFASPVVDRGIMDQIKAGLSSFIWIPEGELEGYVAKSDAILIGPGMMRSHTREHGFVCDDEGQRTRKMTVDLFKKFPEKKWVVDGGSLQVITLSDLPKGAIVTPNRKEFEILFGEKMENDLLKRGEQIVRLARDNHLVILAKDEVSLVTDGERLVSIDGGSDGLIKGGVGDVIAGVTVGFLAKDNPVEALCFASYLVKEAGRNLMNERGLMFNADDLAEEVPKVWRMVQGTW